MKKLLLVIVAVFILLTINACSEESDSITDTTDTNETDINGTWLSSCQELATTNFSGSSIWMYTFNDDSFSANLDVYASADCSGDQGALRTMTGVVTIGESFAAVESGTLVNEIDIKITGTQETPNSMGFDSREIKFAFGNTYYDIFYKEGDVIYFGDTTTGDLSASDQRPNEINFSNVFELQ